MFKFTLLKHKISQIGSVVEDSNYSQLLIHKENVITVNIYFMFSIIFFNDGNYNKEDSFYFELDLFNLYGIILSNRFDGKHLYWRFKWSC